MNLMIYESGCGLTAYTSMLVNNLAAKGCNVFYVTSRKNVYQGILSSKVINLCILKDYNSSLKKKNLSWFIDRLYVSLYNILKRNFLLRNCKIDLVNIHSTVPIIDRFFLKFFVPPKVKFVMTVHNVIPHKKSFFDKGFYHLLKKQDGLIVHTEENVNELKMLFAIEKNVFRIPHGVDENIKFYTKKECKEKLHILSEKKIVLFFGAIKPYKGLDNLIKAMRGLNCFLLIAGHADGNFKKYEKLLEDNEIDCECMVDFIPENEIPYVFQVADLAVLPYVEFHSQSGVLLQIAKYGIPYVSTDVGPFKSYAEKYGNGYICKENSIKGIHDAIDYLLNNSLEREKMKAGSMKMVKEHSWSSVVNLYCDCFETVLGDYERNV